MQLGRYQILKQLASGSIADVLLARAGGLEGFARHVVIKRIKPEVAAEDRFAKAFLEEARIAGSLHHQNIVTVHDIGEQDGAYFFAMEYVHGEDARRLIAKVRDRGENIPLEHALSIVMATAAGLHHAHEQMSAAGERMGLVHRDVSPANILIGYDGSVKIVDFGMAKALSRSSTTMTGTLKGKASYMSPEQCTGKPLDRRTDIFSLGIVLFELITAQRLFKGINDFMTMAAIVEGQIPKPSSLRREIPPALDEIVLRALERSPESRYQTAEALRESLEAFAVAQQLRTSPKSLADYLTGLFGHRPEPWEASASSHPVHEGDDEGTHAKGLVMPPTARPDELRARLSGRSDSPMSQAEGSSDEWDDEDEDVRTAGASPSLAARGRAERPGTENQRTTPSPTVLAAQQLSTITDAQPLGDSVVVPGDTTTTTTTTTTSTDITPDDTGRLTAASLEDSTQSLLGGQAPRGRVPRPTGGDEIDSRTVVEPPIFDRGSGGGRREDDDDEFLDEPATEAATEDPPWMQPGATVPAVRKGPATVPRSQLGLPPTPAASAPAAAGAAPPARPTPPPRPTPSPTRPPVPSRPTIRSSPAPASAQDAAAPTASPPSSSPQILVPPPPAPGFAPPPSSPQILVPPPAPGFAPPPSSPGIAVPSYGKNDPSLAVVPLPYHGPPPHDLRGRVQHLIRKHQTRIWIAGGVALVLLVILASRGCGDDTGQHLDRGASHEGP